MRDLRWLLPYSLRGLSELLRAKMIFRTLEASDIPAFNTAAKTRAVQPEDAPPGFAERVAYVLPRIARRLPWRSDCLIQAIAGQNWLASRGMASEIRIGVERPEDGTFGAHAWLACGDQIVTGGDISRYDLLLGGMD